MRIALLLVPAACASSPVTPRPPLTNTGPETKPITTLEVVLRIPSSADRGEGGGGCPPSGAAIHGLEGPIHDALVRAEVVDAGAIVVEVPPRDPDRSIGVLDVPPHDTDTVVGIDIRAYQGSMLVRRPAGGSIYCVTMPPSRDRLVLDLVTSWAY